MRSMTYLSRHCRQIDTGTIPRRHRAPWTVPDIKTYLPRPLRGVAGKMRAASDRRLMVPKTLVLPVTSTFGDPIPPLSSVCSQWQCFLLRCQTDTLSWKRYYMSPSRAVKLNRRKRPEFYEVIRVFKIFKGFDLNRPIHNISLYQIPDLEVTN